MKAIIGGLVAGFGAYYLVRWLAGQRFRAGAVHGLGGEAGVYGRLYELRDGLQKATQSFTAASKRIEDLDIELARANGEFAQAETDQRPSILSRITGLQRQRDQAVLDAELIIRNVIGPLRYQLITEVARLKSAVVAPQIALERSGAIPKS